MTSYGLHRRLRSCSVTSYGLPEVRLRSDGAHITSHNNKQPPLRKRLQLFTIKNQICLQLFSRGSQHIQALYKCLICYVLLCYVIIYQPMHCRPFSICTARHWTTKNDPISHNQMSISPYTLVVNILLSIIYHNLDNTAAILIMVNRIASEI